MSNSFHATSIQLNTVNKISAAKMALIHVPYSSGQATLVKGSNYAQEMLHFTGAAWPGEQWNISVTCVKKKKFYGIKIQLPKRTTKTRTRKCTIHNVRKINVIKLSHGVIVIVQKCPNIKSIQTCT